MVEVGQRVHGRVDAERGDLTAELGGGVEVGEGGERRRVGVVVGGHVHGLQRRDRATAGRGDALLQLAHLVGQRGLVAHGRGHTAEQRGHLGTGLHEAEDVVHEQQHVLVLHVAEVLGHGERRQGDAQAHARRLVHLAEDQGGLLEHARLFHLEQRSVPSRVRSPTPANTDTPPWFCATRRIISVMSTVLPTPAPPNRPILPPATYGVRRSMTLMPVSNRRFDGSRACEVRGRTVDLPALDIAKSALSASSGFAPHVPHVAECGRRRAR
jgi:hypothetical protein